MIFLVFNIEMGLMVQNTIGHRGKIGHRRQLEHISVTRSRLQKSQLVLVSNLLFVLDIFEFQVKLSFL